MAKRLEIDLTDIFPKYFEAKTFEVYKRIKRPCTNLLVVNTDFTD
jgi:hypothetical protein